MKKLLVISIIAIILAVGGLGSYLSYDNHHISSDLKRTIIAAFDPSVSDSDVRAYLRDARLQVRTKKDAEVQQKFQKLVQLSEESQQLHSQNYQNMDDLLKSVRDRAAGVARAERTGETIREYGRLHRPIPEWLNEEIEKETRESRAEVEQDKLRASNLKLADSESETAKKLLQELRAEVGLPPPPESKSK